MRCCANEFTTTAFCEVQAYLSITPRLPLSCCRHVFVPSLARTRGCLCPTVPLEAPMGQVSPWGASPKAVPTGQTDHRKTVFFSGFRGQFSLAKDQNLVLGLVKKNTTEPNQLFRKLRFNKSADLCLVLIQLTQTPSVVTAGCLPRKGRLRITKSINMKSIFLFKNETRVVFCMRRQMFVACRQTWRIYTRQHQSH